MPSITVALHEAIDLSLEGIGLDDYPIFDEAYREGLNTKIIRHYWNQEIGMETISMFRLALNRRMHEQMPMFNQLYLSEKLKLDPLNTINMSTVNQAENVQSSESESKAGNENSSESSGRTIQQSYPQSALARNKDYAESGADTSQRAGTKSDANEASKAKSDSKDNQTSNTTGFQGSQSMLLMQFRATFLNIDLEVIDSLADCFMGLWDTGDFYTTNNPNRRGYLY